MYKSEGCGIRVRTVMLACTPSATPVLKSPHLQPNLTPSTYIKP